MRNRLLVFRGFADDTQGVLATVEGLTLVRVECPLDFSFRAIVPRLVGVELRTATFTDAKHARGAFYDPKIAFRHESSVPQAEGQSHPCGFQTTPLPVFWSQTAIIEANPQIFARNPARVWVERPSRSLLPGLAPGPDPVP